jgi:hypothetical protein
MGKLDEISSDAAPAEARDFVFGQHPGEPKNAPPRVEATVRHVSRPRLRS